MTDLPLGSEFLGFQFDIFGDDITFFIPKMINFAASVCKPVDRSIKPVKPAIDTLDLDSLKKGEWLYSLSWSNPYTSPPNNQPKVISQGKSLGRSKDVVAYLESSFLNCRGYSISIEFYHSPIKKWSPLKKLKAWFTREFNKIN